MKKFVLLFVFCLILSTVISAFAQNIPDLPAIEKETAKDFLGTWYMDFMEQDGFRMKASLLGQSSVMELNMNNTAVIKNAFGEDSEDLKFWYMEDGKAFLLTNPEDEQESQTIEIVPDGTEKFTVELNGSIIGYTREEQVIFGSGDPVETVRPEDFLGEWYLHSMNLYGQIMPAGMMKLNGTLSINDFSISFTMPDVSFVDVPYEFDGKTISFERAVADVTLQSTAVLKNEGRSLVISNLDSQFTGIDMIFVREADRDTTDWDTFIEMTTSNAQ